MGRGKDQNQRTRRKMTPAEKATKKRIRAAEIRQLADEKRRSDNAARAKFFDSRTPSCDASSSANKDAERTNDPGVFSIRKPSYSNFQFLSWLVSFHIFFVVVFFTLFGFSMIPQFPCCGLFPAPHLFVVVP